ncbi:hypothetical protein THAOC_11545 [Thalassiosira oceanica]|uniref:Uncharacterized protein n=1 Tax=Thalassiosira oceanica TaxID=159749 RepID=K0SM85_THAOC|nr:hypothetical protein THAOC_11545 [Thalassiosira oceanica]|eukprot:EJK67423.1 hypothetical protein THAOC_11545 [Thalassiosira oceanica]
MHGRGLFQLQAPNAWKAGGVEAMMPGGDESCAGGHGPLLRRPAQSTDDFANFARLSASTSVARWTSAAFGLDFCLDIGGAAAAAARVELLWHCPSKR